MFVQWNDKKHSLSIPEIDRQHQQLFHITNMIHEASVDDQERKSILQIFKQLYAYTKYHFSSEEGMLQHFSYPGIFDHKDIHMSFSRKVKKLMDEFRDHPQHSLDETLDYLVNWIMDHIQGDDREYQKYFQENGIEPVVSFASGSGSKQLNDSARELWKTQKLELEIHTIDEQHRELVLILQQFNDLQRASDERKKIFTPTFIQKLFYYSQYHFSYEEELMAKHHYPKIIGHRELHQEFILRIQDFVREYNLGKESLNDEIVHFLKDWTIQHILKEDGKYKSYVQGNT